MRSSHPHLKSEMWGTRICYLFQIWATRQIMCPCICQLFEFCFAAPWLRMSES
jgi:hypothetical protein